MTAYLNSGLKGVAEIYSVFPVRLRNRLVQQHAQLFRQMWRELSEEEKKLILSYDWVESSVEANSEIYRQKLKQLTDEYIRRRQEREREVATYEPEVASALLLDFEKAYSSLQASTSNLLIREKEAESEIQLREQEADYFDGEEMHTIALD